MEPIMVKGIIIMMSVAVGGLCIFLGYKLYDKGVLEKGRMEASGGMLKISWHDYGPGVVFALFGAAVVISGINRDFTTKTTTRGPFNAISISAASPKPAVPEDTEIGAASPGAVAAAEATAPLTPGETITVESETLFY